MAFREDRARERGFTLIEVMVAIVILTVGLIALAQMMVMATSSNSLSGRMTSCSTRAREQMERLRAAPFYSDPLTRLRNPVLQDGGDLENQEGGFFLQYDDLGNMVAGNGILEVRWQIRTVQTNLPLEMLEIRVRCLPAAGMGDQFAIIGEARFTTYRTASVA